MSRDRNLTFPSNVARDRRAGAWCAEEVTDLTERQTPNREQRRHPDKAPADPDASSNPALSEQPPKDSYAGRADQDVTKNTGTGAGGATEYGGGNKNHPSRIASSTPAGQKR
jgi:hypothetical protein